MHLLIQSLTGLVALLHLYFMYLEMFIWPTQKGQKIFNLTTQQAEQTRVLAANQGLYNGFLAAGLVWSLVHPFAEFSHQLQMFFLSCIAVAGIYGAKTVKPGIFWIQACPALLTLVLILLF